MIEDTRRFVGAARPQAGPSGTVWRNARARTQVVHCLSAVYLLNSLSGLIGVHLRSSAFICGSKITICCVR